MKDDYLWDGSGEPDPEIQKLETVLGRFRHDGKAPEFPEITSMARPKIRPSFFSKRFSLGLAAAAAAVLLITAYGVLRYDSNLTTAARPGWDVERVAGTPRVGWKSIGANGKTGKLGVGQTLVTDSHSQATISVSEIGEVRVEPNTRLRLIAKGQGNNRLSLELGTIHAAIWAPPGDFVVDTPSAVAVDLGCAYTLKVDDSGAGLLRTTLGWVGFKLNNHEAFIPAGAVCATRPKIGPGTPYFEDVSDSFRAALYKFDFDALTPERRSAELEIILKESRNRDALTVWHLLARVSDAERGRVYDRLAALVPPPEGVTRDGILRLDQKMLDQWWNGLDLGDVSLWRTWERSGFPTKISDK
jgi:hypothetical protein